MQKWPKSDLLVATSDLEIEGQGHKTIAFVALPIYTHIPNLKVLTKIFFTETMREAGHRTPDIGQRTSDGGKSKNNISTPQGGGHNSSKSS